MPWRWQKEKKIRLRVLTTVIMVFLAVTTVVVGLWLILPKLPYMKIIVIAGLLIGAATAWADVDTVVAAYNVRAYQEGRLQTVDMGHLCSLSDGAVPYIEELTEDANQTIAHRAREYLRSRNEGIEDFRDWNIAGAAADTITKKWNQE